MSAALVVFGSQSACVVEPPAPPTTIELVNNTYLDVRPAFYASGSATSEAGLFLGANLVTTFTDRVFPELRGKETVTLTYACDEILSLGVKQPRMFDALQYQVTRSEDQIFLRQGTDFQCGATVRFVYFTDGDAFSVRVEFP